MLRVREDLFRRTLFHQHTTVEIDNFLCDVAREVHLVRGDQHSGAGVREIAEKIQYLTDERRVGS